MMRSYPVWDRLRAQLDASFQMIRNARDRGISVMSGSDTGNASASDIGVVTVSPLEQADEGAGGQHPRNTGERPGPE
jgi:hypothetical protein